jgi:glutamate dehydrogenase/leucine dehydrogenase
VYFVTPRGLAVKGRLTYEFMKYSLDFYRDVRRHLRENLLAAGVTGQQRVAVYGTGDVAELVYLLLKEMGIDLVAVYDGDGGGAFLGLPIVPLAEHRQTAFDVLIVAVLEKPAAARKRLLAAGIPAGKLLMLQTTKKG